MSKDSKLKSYYLGETIPRVEKIKQVQREIRRAASKQCSWPSGCSSGDRNLVRRSDWTTGTSGKCLFAGTNRTAWGSLAVASDFEVGSPRNLAKIGITGNDIQTNCTCIRWHASWHFNGFPWTRKRHYRREEKVRGVALNACKYSRYIWSCYCPRPRPSR